MKKRLTEMTLEELWQLFPIYLTEHNSRWKDWYEEEKAILKLILKNENIYRISHIGSTAIEKIWAKPIIDILIEIKDSSFDDVKNELLEKDYILMTQSASRLSFNKGYTENGFADRVFHIHLRYVGDNDELYFRDYLNSNPGIAKEYEKLKLSLWKRYENNRDGYTNAKRGFIIKQTNIAKSLYNNRYE